LSNGISPIQAQGVAEKQAHSIARLAVSQRRNARIAAETYQAALHTQRSAVDNPRQRNLQNVAYRGRLVSFVDEFVGTIRVFFVTNGKL
jgi:hypothetical protein